MVHNLVVADTGRDWYRSTSWDPTVAKAFEARMSRARNGNRPQYLRIQATHLIESPDPGVREAGRALLLRVTTDYPASGEATTAMEQLGDSLAHEGQFDEAEHALREALRLCDASPSGRSGTSGVSELRLAEVLLAGDDPARLDEVVQLLRAVQPAVQQAAIIRSSVFRFLLSAARVADRRGDPDAAEMANAALKAATMPSPLSRRPDVGQPTPSEGDLADLERIAAVR